MWRRISHKHKIAYVDQFLMKVRIHGQNMSSNRWLMHRATLKHLFKMHRDTPADLRPMLPHTRRAVISSMIWTAYLRLNEASGNRLFLTLRAIKRGMLSPKAQN